MAKNETRDQPLALAGKRVSSPEELWSHHNAEWRDAAQVVSQWHGADLIDPQLLEFTVAGKWWQTLDEQGITLVVSREYEHLLLSMSVGSSGPAVNFMPMPHPSGIAVDRRTDTVLVASTRNPNQIYDLAAVNRLTERLDIEPEHPDDQPLIPVRSRFLPGCLYMHDLALIGGELHANAVGHNAVVKVTAQGSWQRVWWPKCIEGKGSPEFGQNYIQLNSIAAGETLDRSFFSASGDEIMELRPGHEHYPVDKRGVIFSGASREVIATGLTRPHSARLHEDRIWVDNSGYGELGLIEAGEFQLVTKLPGWTRGLCFHQGIAFVGTSRVIPRFSQYAPGLDVNASICGVHAVDIRSGEVLGSIFWPSGNQIFAIEWLERSKTSGFAFSATGQKRDRKALFYAFAIGQDGDQGEGE